MQIQIKKFIRNSKPAENLAKILFCQSREELFLKDWLDTSLKNYLKFRFYLKRAERGYPLEYLTGKAEFMENEFYVDKNVLIPRPETEMLVEKASEIIGNNKDLNILEVGCGSGAVVISIAKISPANNYFASDISKQALRVAKKNAEKYDVKLNLIHSDLLKKVKFSPDLIVANLPYLSRDELQGLYDPKLALASKNYDSYLIEELLKQACEKKCGNIVLEIGYNQSHLLGYAQKLFPQSHVSIEKDYNDYDRILTIRKPRLK